MQQQNNLYKNYKDLPSVYDGGQVFTAFDTETTGLLPEEFNVIEIGAVKFDKDGIIDTFDILINPGILIPSSATQINHITNEMIENASSTKDALTAFLDFIGNTILIAHNANFDLNFVNAELNRCNMKPLNNKTVDTLNYTKFVFTDFPKFSLQFLAEKLRIDVQNAHRADDDARVCMEVFLKSLETYLQK
jgi:DNA polymerase-3 subunit epsilon